MEANLSEVKIVIDFIELHRQRMAELRRKAARTMGQLSQADLNWRPNPESNSIANLVFHMNGNLRWLVGEGIGKIPYNRDRDGEFNANGDYASAELLGIWNEAFLEVDRILAALTEDRLVETMMMGQREIRLAETLVTVTAHAAEHVGQIIYVAKMRLGPDFKTLTFQHNRKI